MSGHTHIHTYIHTQIHTHRTTTVTLAAHAHRGLITYVTSAIRYVSGINHSTLGRCAPPGLMIYSGNVPHGRDITNTYALYIPVFILHFVLSLLNIQN